MEYIITIPLLCTEEELPYEEAIVDATLPSIISLLKDRGANITETKSRCFIITKGYNKVKDIINKFNLKAIEV